MQIGLLGPLSVVVDEVDHTPTRPKIRSLLAVLVLHRNQRVPTDRLIDCIWGETPPRTARAALQTYVARLRKLTALGGQSVVLVTDGDGYRLDILESLVDVAVFDELVRVGRDELKAADHEAAASTLREALDLWRGEALQDFRYESYAQAEIDRLTSVHASSQADLVEARLELGEHVALTEELPAMVVDQPFRERLWAQLMLALYRSGRQEAALRTYQRARQILGSELGIDPGRDLQLLEEQILLHDPALDLRPESGQTPDRRARSSIPVPITSFIGRDDEMWQVSTAARTHRLVTLVGPPGVGKTRLAVEVAKDLGAAFPDGVWFVGLADTSDPAAIPVKIAEAIGIEDVSGKSVYEALRRFAKMHNALVVLDNCEHILAEAAAVTATLLAAGGGFHVLATSREALGVPGELIVPLQGLQLPAEGDAGAMEVLASRSSVRLFLERAALASPSFTLDEGTAGDLIELCRRLDGLPLALELAASSLAQLGLDDMLGHLGDIRGADGSASHSSLGAAIEWSHRLLSGAEQRLLRRLHVFRGGFTIEAVAQVATLDDILPDDAFVYLRSLAAKSLVSVSGFDEGAVRYHLLESIRAHLWDKLQQAGEEDVLAEEHARFYRELAARGRDHRVGVLPLQYVRRLLADIENFRAAMRTLLSLDRPGQALELATDLWGFWLWLGHMGEGIAWLQRSSVAAEELPRATSAMSQALLGSMMSLSGDTESGDEMVAAATGRARTAGDAWVLAFCLSQLGTCQWNTADLRGAEASVNEGLLVAIERGDTWHEALFMSIRAGLALHRGDLDEAEEASRVALSLHEGLDNTFGRGMELYNLGLISFGRGDSNVAEDLFTEAVSSLRSVGERWYVGLGQIALGDVAFLRDAFDESESNWRSALRVFQELGAGYNGADIVSRLSRLSARRGNQTRATELINDAIDSVEGRAGTQLLVVDILEDAGSVASSRGQHERAALLLGAADSIRATHLIDLPWWRAFIVDVIRTEAQGALDEARYAEQFREGALLTMEQALQHARMLDLPVRERS